MITGPIVSAVSAFQRWTACAGTTTLDFLFPPRCLLCDIDLADTPLRDHGLIHSDTASFCDACRAGLIPPQNNPCLRCGAPLGPFVRNIDGCSVCLRANFSFHTVVRLGLYRDSLRIACLRAKSAGGNLLSQGLARELCHRQSVALAAWKIDAVIPVAEHWLKRFVRPQYAAETIAQEISRFQRLPCSTHILRKPRWTPKQAKSPIAQRREQQRGAFAVSPGTDLTGKTILLVDDILTTGATCDAAARALKQAGAKQVIVAVIAVTPPPA